MTSTTEGRRAQLLIDGQWIDGVDTFSVLDKFSGESMAELPSARRRSRSTPPSRPRERSFDAVQARALRSLSHPDEGGGADRGAQRAARDDDRRRSRLSLSSMRDNEVSRAAQTFIVSAEEGKRLSGEVVPIEAAPGHAHRMAFTIRVPRGVVCGITSFNSPLNMVAHKVAPALASGNTVVVKPPQVDAVQRCAAGRRSCSMPACRPATSTWSRARDPKSAAGWSRTRTSPSTPLPAAPRSASNLQQSVGLRPVALELGSIAATIVCDDADLERAATRCAQFGLSARGPGVHVGAAPVRRRKGGRRISAALFVAATRR